LLDPLEHGPEEVTLVGEVVVESPAGQLRAGDDLLGAHPGIAALGEGLESGADQGVASRLRLRRAATGAASGRSG
jgi:hypothetical protein